MLDLKPRPAGTKVFCERQSRSVAESADAPHRKAFKTDWKPSVAVALEQILQSYLDDLQDVDCAWEVRAHVLLGVYDPAARKLLCPWKTLPASKDLVSADGRVHLDLIYHARTEAPQLVRKFASAASAGKNTRSAAE